MKPRARGTRAVLGVVGCLAVVLAGGCAAGSSAASHPVSPPAASVPATALVLPVEPYLYTPAQLAALLRASVVLERSCLARFGFTLPAPSPVRAYAGGLVPRRYGQTDLDAARQSGYHTLSQSDTNGSPIVLGSLPTAEQLALAGPPPGSDPKVNDIAVPTGGCVGQAEARIGGTAVDFGRSPAAETIKTESYDNSQTAPSVVSALQAWSRCMAADGYHYADPLKAAGDPRWNTPTPTALEIRTALADVACKRSTNLVGIWYAAEATYMNQQISAESDELAQEKSRRDAALKIAATINDSAP